MNIKSYIFFIIILFININIYANNNQIKYKIYLTFDDGPFEGSKNINEIAKLEKINFNVFIVGLNQHNSKLKKYIEEYKKNCYITICNHSFTHAKNKYKKYYKNKTKVLEDFRKNEQFFNITNKYIRLPGRNIWRINNKVKNDKDLNSNLVADFLKSNNYKIVGWDFEWRRRENKKSSIDNPDFIYEYMLFLLKSGKTFTKNNIVILMHDDMFNTNKDCILLKRLIQNLKNNKDLLIEKIIFYPD